MYRLIFMGRLYIFFITFSHSIFKENELKMILSDLRYCGMDIISFFLQPSPVALEFRYLDAEIIFIKSAIYSGSIQMLQDLEE